MKNILATAGALTLATMAASIDHAHAQIDERLWGMSMIGVGKAWENGLRGRGVHIGVMDEWAQPDHPEFGDRWVGGFNVDGTPYGPYGNDFHGTHVTGTIAGHKVGVASESMISGINWAVPVRTDSSYAAGFRWATAQNVRVVNNSWGMKFTDPVTGEKRTLTVADVSPDFFEQNFHDTLTALRESTRADIIQVFATGNSKQPQPDVFSALPYFHPELQSNWIAVTSVGPTGNIASYAERCGVAAAWCLAGPGGDGDDGSNDAIWSSWPGSGYYSINGTSMATPHVTGAVAIAAQLFPQATGSELTQLVLQTATDVGDPGIDPVYGWGLLNIGNIVDTAAPATAGTFANAAWSRFATLGHVSTLLRQRLTAPHLPKPSLDTDFALLSYASTLRDQAGSVITVPNTATPDIWIAPLFGTASINESSSSFGATSHLGGLVIGADFVRNHQARFGLALGYTNTRLETRHADDSGSSDAFHLGAYAGWTDRGWFLEGTGQAAIFNQSIERRAIGGAVGVSFAPVGRSNLSGTGFELSAQAGRRLDLSHDVTIAPYLSVATRWQNTGAGYETGAGIFDLSLPAASYGQVEAGAGLRIESSALQVEYGSLRLAGDISYARLSGDLSNATSVTLLGGSIEGQSAALGRDILRLGAELNLATSENRDWFAHYQGNFQRNANSHALSVGMRISF